MWWLFSKTYLQSITVRVEEWRLKQRDTEEWMRHRQLPCELRERVRRFIQYKWLATRGVNEESILQALPADLRRDIKRHLCLDLVRRVNVFTWFFQFTYEVSFWNLYWFVIWMMVTTSSFPYISNFFITIVIMNLYGIFFMLEVSIIFLVSWEKFEVICFSFRGYIRNVLVQWVLCPCFHY